MTSNLNPYPSYKPSSVEWLGDVPAHWEVRRLKQAVTLMMGQSPPGDECSEKPIGLPFLQGCAEFGERHPSPVQFCRAPQKVSPIGTILLSVRAPVGRLNIADQEYGIGRGLCALLPHKRVLQTAFARYHLEVLGHGLRLASTGSTYDAVSVGDVGNQPLLVPPLAEQAAIVRYLDHTDGRIRRYLRSRERLIELLKEYRQAVVHEAVTRGLDPDVPLKPSGVEWLGDVPAHWEVRRLRHAVNMRVSNVDKHSKDDELPVRLCNYVDVYKNDRITESVPFMRATAKADEMDRFRLELGDVLITKDSEVWNDIGVPAFVEYSAKDLICGYHLALLRPLRAVLNGAYLFHSLQSSAIASQFHLAANGVTRYGLSLHAIKSALLPIPPLAEQAAIAAYLDKQTAAIDAAMARARREIELLSEYRTRLIADVVTGQVDVREAAD